MKLLEQNKKRIKLSANEQLDIMEDFMNYVHNKFVHVRDEFVSFMIREGYRHLDIKEGKFFLIDSFFASQHISVDVVSEIEIVDHKYPVFKYSYNIQGINGKLYKTTMLDEEEAYLIDADTSLSTSSIGTSDTYRNKFIAQLFAYKSAFDELNHNLKNNDLKI